jgi:hypothetical protein
MYARLCDYAEQIPDLDGMALALGYTCDGWHQEGYNASEEMRGEIAGWVKWVRQSFAEAIKTRETVHVGLIFLAKARLKWWDTPTATGQNAAQINIVGGLLESIHAATGTQPAPPVRTIDIDPAAAARPPPDAATGAPCPGVPIRPDLAGESSPPDAAPPEFPDLAQDVDGQ